MEVCSHITHMLNQEEKDSPEKCRERRRRRIEMRRRLVSAASNRRQNNQNNNTNISNNNNPSQMANPIPNLNMNNVNVDMVPVVGSMSVAGRQREMEDTISVRMNLCRPEINGLQPIHFFAVFDGHGGAHVAAMCREKLHMLLKEELMRVVDNTATGASGAGSSIGLQPPGQGSLRGFLETWERVLKTSFLKMDEVVRGTCDCEALGYLCECGPDEVALSGSTAVVAILTTDYIIVANCGDSRAVLCRGGRAIPLSFDHKPDRADERARIEAEGGRVIINDGPRVEGILAMSRAIGDKYLKPYVTAEPEISFTKRCSEDECLILASDGLWDVMPNDMACDVARECLSTEPPGGERTGAFYPSRSAAAASLLTRLALGRHSADNISAIVVDLKRAQNAA